SLNSTDSCVFFFFFQAEDGIRDFHVTGVQTCALPILNRGLTHKGPFEVVKNGLQPHERQVVFEGLDPSNYFTVSALGKDKEVRRSEERRVGKECRARWARWRQKKEKDSGYARTVGEV